MRFKCKYCDRITVTTNPKHRDARLECNMCKDCQYIVGFIKLGVKSY